MTQSNLKLSSVGPTPFSTVPWSTHPAASELNAREPSRPMTYVMSFPSVVQDPSVDPDAISPSRHPNNFFKQLDEAAEPAPLPGPADFACQPDHRRPGGLRGNRALRPGAKAPPPGSPSTLPRDTLHPLISQMQAEANSKAAYFHPQVGYLSNARRDEPPCKAQLYDGRSGAQRVQTETNGAYEGEGGSDDEGAHHDNTVRNTKRHTKRGDLSVAVGRRYFTDGCLHEPDHYASSVESVANTQPNSVVGIAAKALANAIHNPHNESRRTPVHKTTAYRNLSSGLQDILSKRNREGRFEVSQYLEKHNALVLPPPLQPDRGVVVEAVDVPHDPFSSKRIYAPNDGPDAVDQVGVEPPDVAAVCGPDSILNIWNIVIKRLANGPADATEAVLTPQQPTPTNNNNNTSSSAVHQRVLTPYMVSLFGPVSATPNMDALVSKGVRQGISQRQPTAPSKSSFTDNGVLPTTQFADLDLVPPNCVGFDSERFSVILKKYGSQLEEVLLDGASWLSHPSISLIGNFCPNLRVLNISSCPQVDDECVAAITAGCPNLALVNISCCKGITSAAIDSILSNTTNLIALSCSGLEQIDDTSAVAWSNLHRHRTLQYLDLSFCLRLPDAALVQAAMFCPELEMLDITGCTSLTDVALYSVGGSCRKLAVLRLRMCMMFSTKALETFATASTGITNIDFTGCQELEMQTLEGFLTRCPKITHLNLASCSKLEDPALIVLEQRAPNLEVLNLAGCSAMTCSGLMRLIHMIKVLRKIDMSGTRISKTEKFVLSSVRESCELVKITTETRTKRRLHAFMTVEPKKPAPKNGAGAKGRK